MISNIGNKAVINNNTIKLQKILKSIEKKIILLNQINANDVNFLLVQDIEKAIIQNQKVLSKKLPGLFAKIKHKLALIKVDYSEQGRFNNLFFWIKYQEFVNAKDDNEKLKLTNQVLDFISLSSNINSNFIINILTNIKVYFLELPHEKQMIFAAKAIYRALGKSSSVKDLKYLQSYAKALFEIISFQEKDYQIFANKISIISNKNPLKKELKKFSKLKSVNTLLGLLKSIGWKKCGRPYFLIKILIMVSSNNIKKANLEEVKALFKGIKSFFNVKWLDTMLKKTAVMLFTKALKQEKNFKLINYLNLIYEDIFKQYLGIVKKIYELIPNIKNLISAEDLLTLFQFKEHSQIITVLKNLKKIKGQPYSKIVIIFIHKIIKENIARNKFSSPGYFEIISAFEGLTNNKKYIKQLHKQALLIIKNAEKKEISNYVKKLIENKSKIFTNLYEILSKRKYNQMKQDVKEKLLQKIKDKHFPELKRQEEEEKRQKIKLEKKRSKEAKERKRMLEEEKKRKKQEKIKQKKQQIRYKKKLILEKIKKDKKKKKTKLLKLKKANQEQFLKIKDKRDYREFRKIKFISGLKKQMVKLGKKYPEIKCLFPYYELLDNVEKTKTGIEKEAEKYKKIIFMDFNNYLKETKVEDYGYGIMKVVPRILNNTKSFMKKIKYIRVLLKSHMNFEDINKILDTIQTGTLVCQKKEILKKDLQYFKKQQIKYNSYNKTFIKLFEFWKTKQYREVDGLFNKINSWDSGHYWLVSNLLDKKRLNKELVKFQLYLFEEGYIQTLVKSRAFKNYLRTCEIDNINNKKIFLKWKGLNKSTKEKVVFIKVKDKPKKKLSWKEYFIDKLEDFIACLLGPCMKNIEKHMKILEERIKKRKLILKKMKEL
ncbi:hypothetical protein ACFL2K_00400 [Candidatus Margulisiibacteriota bacterium]